MSSPDICVNKHRGNPESVSANPEKARKETLRLQVEAYLRQAGLRGATSDELELALGLTHQAASPRLTELVARGYAIRGERRMTRSGRWARALVLSEFA